MGIRGVLAGATLAVVLPVMALAQVPSAGRSGFHPQFQSKDKNISREAPPPALPGAASNPETTTRKGAPIDLPPTEALFDSINRGDMVEARDALARGADLQALNVLGMTPIALSVDLGRNDITFLLLSFHGGASPAPSAVAADTAAPARTSRRPIKSAAIAGSTLGARSSAPAPAQRRNPSAARPTVTASGTPGVPVPQAGFLGFGGSAQN